MSRGAQAGLRIVLGEDCAEFRMLRYTSGERADEDWLLRFLEPEFGDAPDPFLAALLELDRGWEFQDASAVEDLGGSLGDADGLLVERRPVVGADLDEARKLRRIVKFGSDLDTIDREACERRGIPVVAMPRRANASVADHVLMLLLALVRRLTRDARIVPGGPARPIEPASTEEGGHPPTVFNWYGVRGMRCLDGVRLGVIGPGETGQAVLRRAGAFGMACGYWGRSRNERVERELGARWFPDPLALASWADVVSLHVPYSPELRHLVDEDFLDRLGPEGLLVNTARGLLVDEAALFEALTSGRLGGAGLDVFAQEPLPAGHPLVALPNVIATPHVGASSRWTLLADLRDIVREFEALETV